MRQLDIGYLLESTDVPWGGVQTVFREAEALVRMGHEVTLYSKTETPGADDYAAEIKRVSRFAQPELRPHDLMIGTYYTTVTDARQSGCGRPVHFCQGYEGDSSRAAEELIFVESAYQLEGMSHICVAPSLARRLRERFGIDPVVVPYGIDIDLYRPGPAPPPGGPLRVALVGPWEIEWKGIPVGVAAARQAFEQGVDLELVRISPTKLREDESSCWGEMPVEWHENLTQAQMPPVYRSCDLFLGTTLGGTESFFMPAMEAMSCGLPVVLSDVWCFHDYDHDAPFTTFIKPGDSDGFTNAIVELARDPEQRAHWRTRSLEVSRRHSFERHLSSMETALQNLVPSGQARSERGRPFDPNQDLPPGAYQRWQTEQTLRQHAATTHDYEEAARILRTLLEIQPDNASTWNLLARTELGSGNCEAALAAIDRYHALDPMGLTGRRIRGLLHLRRHDFAAATRDFNEAIRGGHPGANIHLELTLALLGNGDPKSADLTLARATEIQPFDARSHALIAEIEASIGQLQPV